MNENARMNEKQTKLLIDTIGKNDWSTATDLRFDVWSNFHESPDVLRNYLCKDGSGYIRGFYDGSKTFYVKKFHLRDEEWADPHSPQS
jgi:hypothetical protein